MVKQTLKSIISGLLKVFLTAATIWHAGLVVYGMFLLTVFPKEWKPPVEWMDLLGWGADEQSFWAYMLALMVCLVWEVAANPDKAHGNKGILYTRQGSGTIALVLWAFLYLFASRFVC